MEHQVTVPFPADDVRRTLADPVRLRRCVPGLQVSAGDETGSDAEVAGRLKLRIAGSTITYRGVLRLTAQDGGVRIEAEGHEVRGEGGAKASLTIAADDADGATQLRITGTVDADGRLAEADPKAAESAARRLLDRFAAELAAELKREGPPAGRPAAGKTGKAAKTDAPAAEQPATEDAPEPAESAESETTESGTAAPEPAEPETAAEEPAAADTAPGPEDGAGQPAPPRPAELPGREIPPEELLPDEPESEALVNGRRTMIGRSAEEVDHAPPRGRYAPVPSPATVRSRITALRWAGPAAAVVASAVVVGRMLRRRR
jgi:carbon monoxide dehydrogenase subunit G